MPADRRSVRKQEQPDLESLAGRLLFTVHREIFDDLAAGGFDDIRSRHAGIVAILDDEGVRPGDIARFIGRSKQTTGATLDELERLGYVARHPDPADRRASLVVLTDRGRELVDRFDAAVARLEESRRALLGEAAYDALVAALRQITSHPGIA